MIESTYSFNTSHHWFIIHLNAVAAVTAVEEHDHYAGGQVKPRDGESQEQLFIRLAKDKGFGLYEIENFLRDSKARTLGINSKSYCIWNMYGNQGTELIDSDLDLEALVKRSGRTNWHMRFVNGKMEFGSSELVSGVGIQYTIRKLPR